MMRDFCRLFDCQEIWEIHSFLSIRGPTKGMVQTALAVQVYHLACWICWMAHAQELLGCSHAVDQHRIMALWFLLKTLFSSLYHQKWWMLGVKSEDWLAEQIVVTDVGFPNDFTRTIEHNWTIYHFVRKDSTKTWRCLEYLYMFIHLYTIIKVSSVFLVEISLAYSADLQHQELQVAPVEIAEFPGSRSRISAIWV